MRIFLSSGGTGGHVFPAIALGESLRRDGYDVTYITDQRGARYFKNVPYFKAPVYRKHPILRSLIYPLSMGWQVLRCVFLIIRKQPEACIGFGGYPSFPMMLAGRLLGKKLFLHEQNSVCGQANRFLSKWAKVMALSFEKTERVPTNIVTYYTGNFVRSDILASRNAPMPEGDKLSILVTGGSQGASLFTTLIPEALKKIPLQKRENISIVQQCRGEDIPQLQSVYEVLGVEFELKPFFEDMPKRYRACDMIIARSGASTVAEVLTVGRPAIYVPLKISKESDQEKNAAFCVSKKVAWSVVESGAPQITAILSEIINDRSILNDMKKHLDAIHYPDAVGAMKELINHSIVG